MTERVHSLRGLLLRRLWLPLLVLLLCSAVGSFALARFYAGQVYDRWLLDSAMSLSELVTVQDGRASIEITPAVSRMFSWDTADEVHGEVVDAEGGRLYGDLPEALQLKKLYLLLEDEKTFIALPKSPLWWGEEKVIIEGAGT